jgi:phosphate transport system protein
MRPGVIIGRVNGSRAAVLADLEEQTIGTLDTVVAQLGRAIEALTYQDVELAAIVVADDDRIDANYLAVHQGVLSVLAARPLEPDELRLAVALLHCVRSIERMGDQCVNIAKLVVLSGHEVPKDKDILDWIERMGRGARSQLLEVKDAFKTRNLELARDLVRQDSEINRLNRAIFKRAVEVGDRTEMREWAMFMILVARCLERVGDQTVDVAEQVVFAVTGRFEEMADASRPRPHGAGR